MFNASSPRRLYISLFATLVLATLFLADGTAGLPLPVPKRRSILPQVGSIACLLPDPTLCPGLLELYGDRDD